MKRYHLSLFFNSMASQRKEPYNLAFSEQSMKRVLVTGGSGFIGLNCISELLEKGVEVHVLDVEMPANSHPLINHMNISWFLGSILDEEIVDKAMNGCDAVVHLAAQSSVPESMKDPARTMAINLDGTKNIHSSALKCGVSRIVFASSAAVYGAPDYLPLTEESPCSPQSPYGQSKFDAERFLMNQESPNVSSIALRFFNVYGATSFGRGRGVIPSIFDEINNNQRCVLFGEGKQTRDFVHVHDVVCAILLSLDCEIQENRSFNICSNTSISMLELQQYIGEVFRKRGHKIGHELIFKPSRGGDILHSLGSYSKASMELGWSPKEKFLSSLDDFYPIE
jgi:UDP-glucose 4-epimerase